MDIENLIKTQPHKADAMARDWTIFASQHSGVSHFEFKQEFIAWANIHKNENIDTSVWVGKEIQDAYFYRRAQHEEEQMEQTGHVDSHDVPDALAAFEFLGALFNRQRPKILEQDPHFKQILKEKKEAWLAKNPGKDINSKEWIDYRYGSLENPKAPTLFSHAEEEFKTKHETLWKKYSEERKKVYDDPSLDPTLKWHQEEIELHTEARHKLLQKTNSSITIEHVQKQVETAHWEKFVETHPEKVAAYAGKHEGVKEAIARIEEKNKLKIQQLKTEQKQKEKQGIHDQLINYQQTKGKEIHYVEGKTHRPPDISVSEATRRLEAITPPPPSIPILKRTITPSIGLVDSQGRPIGTMPSIPPQQQPPQQTTGEETEEERDQRTGRRVTMQDRLLGKSTHAPSGIYGGGYGAQGKRITESGSGRLKGGLNRAKNSLKGASSLARGARNLLSNPGDFLSDSVEKLARRALIRFSLSFLPTYFPALIILFLSISVALVLISNPTIGEASPENGVTTSTLDYNIPFRNPGINTIPLDQIKSTILASWPNAKLDQWQTIIDKSIANGWNPAFVLTLWIEESGAQGMSTYTDPLGCDPKHPTTDINVSLNCLFNNFPINKYSNNNFADFMCVYGGDGFHRAPCTFVKENPNFPPNIKTWYSKLVPSGIGAIISIPSAGTGPIVPVGQGGERIASTALQIASQLINSVNPGMPGCDVGSPNGNARGHYQGFHCWAEMTNPEYDEAKDSDYLQCTEFVWATFKKAGFSTQINLINGDAQNWVESARNHQDIFAVLGPNDANQLQKGDIVSLGSSTGDVGHVAIVIDREENVVKVAQSATDNKTESWDIKNGRLVPYDQANRRTRTIVEGFIRLK